MASPGAERQSPGVRRVAALLACLPVAFAGASLILKGALDRAGIEAPRTVLDSVDLLLRHVALLAGRPAGEASVALVGDSHLMGVDRSEPLHGWLRRVLRERGVRTTVWRIADHGLTPFGHYCLCEIIAEAAPDAVVVELNLASFSGSWQRRRRTQLAVLLGPGRWLEAARLPLHGAGVSLDRLLFYSAIRGLGGMRSWRRLEAQQARVVGAARAAARVLQERSPWPDGLAYERALEVAEVARSSAPGGRRASAQWARTVLGPALGGVGPEHPTLRLLDAILARYAEAGIEVLVFVNPINVEHLRELGLYDEAGLGRTLANGEATARRRGARWLDLHDLLPDAAFRDPMDHLEPGADGPPRRLLAERLADALGAPRGPGP